METISLTVDKDMLEEIDEIAKKLGCSRSYAIRKIINDYFRQRKEKELDKNV